MVACRVYQQVKKIRLRLIHNTSRPDAPIAALDSVLSTSLLVFP